MKWPSEGAFVNPATWWDMTAPVMPETVLHKVAQFGHGLQEARPENVT